MKTIGTSFWEGNEGYIKDACLGRNLKETVHTPDWEGI